MKHDTHANEEDRTWGGGIADILIGEVEGAAIAEGR